MDAGIYVGLVGTTFRRGGAAQLSHFSLPQPYASNGSLPPEVVTLAQEVGLTECIYLATCNRVEILFAAPRRLPVTTVRRRIEAFFSARTLAAGWGKNPPDEKKHRCMHAYSEDGAMERLFVIAAALDSMMPGEAQVLGQLKQASEKARELGLVGRHLAPLLKAAGAAAKKVRERTALGTGRVSMLSLAESNIQAHLDAVTDRAPTVAVVGAGEMARLCAQRFMRRDNVKLLIVNRTEQKALELARLCGGAALSLGAFLAGLPSIDILLTATASPHPVFDGSFFVPFVAKHKMAPLTVDLAIPPDVDCAAARAAGAPVINFSALSELAQKNRLQREGKIAEARALIDEAILEFEAQRAERHAAQMVLSWRDHCRSVLRARLAQRPDSQDPKAMELWARRLAAALAHPPTQGLKTLAQVCGDRGLNAFAQGAKLASRPSLMQEPDFTGAKQR